VPNPSKNVQKILENLTMDEDGIYSYPFENKIQVIEFELRKKIAKKIPNDYLGKIAQHHSIPVMDKEVAIFLSKMPKGALIIDVGGCWGWHWRNLNSKRPDVSIFIVDFVRENLRFAREVLGELIDKNIFLIHGDATELGFAKNVFDGYWSVQALQHVPNFEDAINESYKVLKAGGYFSNYSLNTQPWLRFFYNLFGKYYHVEGFIPGSFYLARASENQAALIRNIFGKQIQQRYSEILFQPDLNLKNSGKQFSLIGKLDGSLSGSGRLSSWLARQRSFHAKK